jgi:chloramphenicol-sensitive protein RarD
MLIGVNWLVFIWAVGVDRLLEASFGYYLNPLVNVLLGVVVLGERLPRLQAFAVVLAGAGVARLAAAHGGLPWVSLALAASFGLYGLMHKIAPVLPLVGLMIESAVLAPLAMAYLVWRAWQGADWLGGGEAVHLVPLDLVLVPLSGPLTAVPLGCFAAAAARLKLSTLGLFQYIAPTLGVLLAVLLYGEPFAEAQAVALGFIWSALALYSFDALRRG